MTTLILGAAGMLGHKLCQQLSAAGRDRVYGTLRRPVAAYERCRLAFGGAELIGGIDLLDEDLVASTVRELGPEVIVNCVGIVKQLEEAEDRMLSILVNSLLPHRLARLAETIGARLIHISTDCVFDGVRGGYLESDPSDAKDLYGRTKFLGETDPREPAAVTLRTSIIGHEMTAPTHGLIEWFLAQEGGRIQGFAKAIYTGITTLEMGRVIQRVVDRGDDLCGVYHVASTPINKYELLLLARHHYGLEIEIERDESLVCDRSLVMERFSAATGYQAPSWDEMIRELAAERAEYENRAEERP